MSGVANYDEMWSCCMNSRLLLLFATAYCVYLRFWNKTFVNKKWLSCSVFEANGLHALFGLKECQAAKVRGLLVVLGEISFMDTLCGSDV